MSEYNKLTASGFDPEEQRTLNGQIRKIGTWTAVTGIIFLSVGIIMVTANFLTAPPFAIIVFLTGSGLFLGVVSSFFLRAALKAKAYLKSELLIDLVSVHRSFRNLVTIWIIGGTVIGLALLVVIVISAVNF